jgi:hypothetical protein
VKWPNVFDKLISTLLYLFSVFLLDSCCDDMTLILNYTVFFSLDKGHLIYKIKVLGANFPADGPVMQKKTLGWEPCTEMRYLRDGVLCGQSLMALKCADGNYLTCHLKSTYRYLISSLVV